MTKKSLITVSTIVIAIVAFLLTRVIWPDVPGMEGPPGSLLPWFIGIGVMEAVAFGLGVSLLLFYWKEGSRQLWPFVSVIWLLVSWWPHSSAHRTWEEGNWVGLLLMEYGYHVTLMIAGFILARFVMQKLSETAPRQP